MLFSDFLEGELSPEETARLRSHLDGCEPCQTELEELRQTLNSLSGMKHIPPPPGFLNKVKQRIRKRSRGRFFAPDKLLNRLPFEWISFIIILIMLVYFMYTMQATVTDVKPDPKAKGPTEKVESKEQTVPKEGGAAPKKIEDPKVQ